MSNLDHSYRNLRIGIVLGTGGTDSRSFAIRLQDALARKGGYFVRIYGSADAPRDVDVIVDCRRLGIEESANGSNFFVAFPGFIIFTHAWLGYGYEYERRTAINVRRAADNAFLTSLNKPLSIDIRYADFETTFGNGLGWITWLCPLINGFVQMANFDDDLHDHIQKEVYPVYADNLATELVKAINRQDWRFIPVDRSAPQTQKTSTFSSAAAARPVAAAAQPVAVAKPASAKVYPPIR